MYRLSNANCLRLCEEDLNKMLKQILWLFWNIILNSDGSESGRIVGYVPWKEFLKKINSLLHPIIRTAGTLIRI